MISTTNLSKSLAVFAGVLAVFVYLILADPVGIPEDRFPMSMLSALFSYAVSVEVLGVILVRSLLIFMGVFSLTSLVVALLQKNKA